MSDKVSDEQLQDEIDEFKAYGQESTSDYKVREELKAARNRIDEMNRSIQQGMYFLADRLGDDDFNNAEAILAKDAPYPTQISELDAQLKAAREVLDGECVWKWSNDIEQKTYVRSCKAWPVSASNKTTYCGECRRVVRVI